MCLFVCASVCARTHECACVCPRVCVRVSVYVHALCVGGQVRVGRRATIGEWVGGLVHVYRVTVWQHTCTYQLAFT